MLKPKSPSSGRRLDLPKYSLSNKEKEPKSCFINSNRIDTVRPGLRFFSKEAFIKSDYFREMIFKTCYEACVSDNKIISLSCGGNDKIRSYLENFFVSNNFGVIDELGYAYFYSTNIKIKLNENITFEDIGVVYISELEKVNLSAEEIQGKRLMLQKKVNNEEN